MNLDTRVVYCPYCNEPIELAFERLDGLQEYIEDCHVCCQPKMVQELEMIAGDHGAGIELLDIAVERGDAGKEIARQWPGKYYPDDQDGKGKYAARTLHRFLNPLDDGAE